MNLANKCIGIIGVDYYDVIYYLSRILFHLNKKILLMDYSINRSLEACIPCPESLTHEVDVIHWKGVDYTGLPINMVVTNYDMVLVYYGLYQLQMQLEECDRYILVTDMQVHNQLIISNLDLDSNKVAQVVIKDAYDSIQMEKVSRLKQYIKQEHTHSYVLYQDVSELRYREYCQEHNLNKFKGISKDLKNYLHETIRLILVDISDKELQLAYKKAERGL